MCKASIDLSATSKVLQIESAFWGRTMVSIVQGNIQSRVARSKCFLFVSKMDVLLTFTPSFPVKTCHAEQL